jgi:hypothetical protein
MEEKQPLDLPYYKCVRQRLENILLDPKYAEPIQEAVYRVHRIVIHTLQFIKLYFLHLYGTDQELPKLTDDFVTNVMKVICIESMKGHIEKRTRRPPKQETIYLQDLLSKFFNEHYRSTIFNNDILDSTGILRIFEYVASDIVTIFETNIKQHYVSYVERFLNVLYDKKERLSTLCNTEKTALLSTLRNYKKSILDCHAECKDEVLREHFAYLRPQRDIIKNSLPYDLKARPQDYLPCMIYMMRFIESKEQTIYNVFPLRTDIIPKYIRLDTHAIIDVLFDSLPEDENREYKSYFKTHIKETQTQLWSLFLNTNMRCFRPKNSTYQFNYMIETDGVACSILLVRKDVAGKRIKPKQSNLECKEQYITDVPKEELQNKAIVGIDPNKSDLIYCTQEIGMKDLKTFRYTQDQRRKETKTKKFRNVRNKLKVETKYDNKTVQELETELSVHNKKTLNFQSFLAYVTKKNEINSILLPYYENELFRKMKFHSKINVTRSEDKMINRFKVKFGEPDKVVIGFGDWEQKQQMKYKEPTKGIGMRKLFCKAGYKVYLVDEFRTSCRCYACGGECEHSNERRQLNPRPWMRNEREYISVHGLLKCKTCNVWWNRDKNSALNIQKIVKCFVEGKERPVYLQRGTGTGTNSNIQLCSEA